MKEKIISLLSKLTNIPEIEISNSLEVPPSQELGDYAFPCFSLAKSMKKNPVQIAQDLAKKIKSKELENVEAKGPYLNFFLDSKSLSEKTITEILNKRERYGSSNQGTGKTIAIDMSSPNIAKPFGIGHLRSTIIGNSIAEISKFNGFKAIKHLLEVYVKVNEDESLEEEARQWFRKLEQGDKEAMKLWKEFKSLSLKEFNKLYKLLGIKFDVISGEYLYNDKMDAVVEELENKGLLQESEGAKIIDLNKYNLGACLIKKSDGATLYATRDITAAIDRYNTFKFHKLLYEVGAEQKLHFKQFFKVLELMEYNWAKDCIHVDHGLYLDKDGKKFATRKGKTIFMEDIFSETKELAKKEVENREKLPTKELEKRASTIALAAIFYGDLKNYRSNDMIFDIENFVSFEGNTGPYLLYSYARAKSILRKAKYKPRPIKITALSPAEKQLISKLAKFPEIVSHAYTQLAPNLIANYAHELSQMFNEFYHSEKVIGSENEQFKLSLVESFSIVLKNSLALLGISVLEKM